MRLTRIRLLLAVALVAVPCLGASSARAAEAPRSAIVVVLDGVTLAELNESAPKLMEEVQKRGAVGLMPSLRDDARLRLAGYMALSAGSPVDISTVPLVPRGVHELQEPLEAGTALQAWRRRAGLSPGDAEGVVPDIVALTGASFGMPDGVGTLGQLVRDANMQTVYVGDASVGSDPLKALRPAGFIAGDARGLVDTARTTTVELLAEPAFPFGYRADYTALSDLVSKTAVDGGLTVVDLGDFRRASFEARIADSEAASAQRKSILAVADPMLARIARQAGPERLVVFASLSGPAERDPEDGALLPVIMMGDGIEPGLIAAPTTRRPGLLTIADVHETLLASLGLAPVAVAEVAPSGPAEDPVARMLAAQAAMLDAHSRREPVLAVYLVVQQLLLLALALPLWPLWSTRGKWSRALVLLPLLTAPLLLPAALVPGAQVLGPVAAWMLACVALAFGLAYVPDGRVAVLAASAGSVVLISADLLLGASLQSLSALGYDLVIGGRFYGIGNEYMGVLVGAAVAACAAIVDRWGSDRRVRWACVAVLFAISGLFALPNAGADAGGALTALAAAGAFAWVAAEHRPSPARGLVTVVVFAVLASAAVVLANIFGALPASHVSRFIERAGEGDFSYVTELVARKVGANLFVAASWPWGPGLVIALGVLMWLAWSRRRAADPRPPFGSGSLAGVCALVVASLAGFALNDSGATSVVTMSAYLGILLLGLWEPAGVPARSLIVDAALTPIPEPAE